MLVLVGLGFGNILGAQIIAQFIDHFTNRSTISACMAVICMNNLSFLLYIYNYQFSYVGAIIVAFIWGV